MLKKLILIENGEEVQCDTLEDVVKVLIDENYYSLTDEEKKNKMRMKAMANCLNLNKKIVENIDSSDNLDDVFIIEDEVSYVLSLIMVGNVILLEHVDANIFLKNYDNIGATDNYIVVNKEAKELLEIKIHFEG